MPQLLNKDKSELRKTCDTKCFVKLRFDTKTKHDNIADRK